MSIIEYIWIDGIGRVRSKARTLLDEKLYRTISDIPEWNFDGSSTGQAVGDDSEVILKPQYICPDPFSKECGDYLVLCDCYNKNGMPLETNKRYRANEMFKQVSDKDPWYGLEQEYVLYSTTTRRPLGWDEKHDPEPQGKYYCGVGADRAFGREIVRDHYRKCLYSDIQISGVNGEVMPGQWEFQVGPCEGILSGDQVWIARYILHRVAEKYSAYVSFNPKPMKGDWNGSGCHVNYSSKQMREENGLPYIYDAIYKLEAKHYEHILVYGTNKNRLTGTHETSNIDIFTYGVGDRTASIRIPICTEKEGKGYLEDRRPAADCDPYLVTSIIAETTLM